MGRRPTTIPPVIVRAGAGSQSTSTSSGSTITWTHTVEDIAYAGLIVVAHIDYTSDNPITGVTFGGVPLTPLFDQEFAMGSLSCRQEVWYLANPAVGAGSIVVTTTNNMSTTNHGAAAAVAVFGVNQVTPANFNTASNALGGTGESNLANLATRPRAIVFDFTSVNGNPTIVPAAGQTTLASLQQGGLNTSEYCFSYVTQSALAGSIQISDTWTGAQDYGQICFTAVRK